MVSLFLRGPVFGPPFSSTGMFLESLSLLRACFWNPFVFRGPCLDSFAFRGHVFTLPLSSAGVSLDCLYCNFTHHGFVFGSLCLWAPFVFRRGLVFVLSLSSAFFEYFPSVCFWWLFFGHPPASGTSFLDLLWLPGPRFWTFSAFRRFVFGLPLASGASFLDLFWLPGPRFWTSSGFRGFVFGPPRVGRPFQTPPVQEGTWSTMVVP